MTRMFLSARPSQFPGRQQFALQSDQPWCQPWQPGSCYQPVLLYQDVGATISAAAGTAGSFYMAKNVTIYCVGEVSITATRQAGACLCQSCLLRAQPCVASSVDVVLLMVATPCCGTASACIGSCADQPSHKSILSLLPCRLHAVTLSASLHPQHHITYRRHTYMTQGFRASNFHRQPSS